MRAKKFCCKKRIPPTKIVQKNAPTALRPSPGVQAVPGHGIRRVMAVFSRPKDRRQAPLLGINGVMAKKFRDRAEREKEEENKHQRAARYGTRGRRRACGGAPGREPPPPPHEITGRRQYGSQRIKLSHRASRARRALPRWLRAFFCSRVSSAAAFPREASKKTGS